MRFVIPEPRPFLGFESQLEILRLFWALIIFVAFVGLVISSIIRKRAASDAVTIPQSARWDFQDAALLLAISHPLIGCLMQWLAVVGPHMINSGNPPAWIELAPGALLVTFSVVSTWGVFRLTRGLLRAEGQLTGWARIALIVPILDICLIVGVATVSR